MRSTNLAALAALCAFATSASADVKTPRPGVPSFDVDTLLPAPIQDDATRSPLQLPPAAAPLVGAAEREQLPAQRVAVEMPFPLYDVDEHGNVWTRGRSFKASFGTDGATFIPRLGPRAPRNFPVRFTVDSVTSGGASVEFVASVPATRDGDVVAFERGSFVEQYVVAADSIEQRFVFDTLPSRGELVVSIDVASELASRSDDAGFRFENELGHVRYGRAFALDARGTKVGIESRLEGGRIELVVPAAFVATAELPLVIDPLTSTISVDVDSESEWQSDVAFDDTFNAFLVVYEDQFSATDHDVYGRRYIDQVLIGTATIDFTSDDWRNPKVANNNLQSQFLCVAQVGASPTRIIRGRTISAFSGAVGTQFTISGSEAGDKTVPDVGGDPATVGPTYYCVVWQREDSGGDYDVHAQIVTNASTLLNPTTNFLANLSTTNDQFPSISKTNGQPPFGDQNWHILWQHETSATNDDIWGARILWDGTVTNSLFVAANTAENERAPAASPILDVTGAPRYWLAAYTIGSDLRMRVFDGIAVEDTTDLVAGGLSNYGQPTVATDGRRWPLAYTITSGAIPFLDTDLYAATLNYVAGQFTYAEVPVVLANSSTLDETRPEIANTHTSTQTGPWRNYVTYDLYNGTDYDVFAAVYDSPVNAGGYLYCDGTSTACPCANGNNQSITPSGCASSVNQAGAHLNVTGIWSVTADSTLLVCTGMPASAPCLFFQGTGQNLNGAFFGDGLRCAVGTIIRLGTKTASGGAASYGYPADEAIHVRGNLLPTGGWRYYQCWYRNSASYCTTSTFNTSNAAALLWAY